MKCVVIYPGQAPILKEVDGYKGLVAEVGGYIELVGVGEDFSCYVNEDGIALGLSRNEAATKVVTNMLDNVGRSLLPGDYIKGAAVFCGASENGEDTDIPDNVVDTYFADLR